jgi:hypothetical protein
VAVYRMGKVDRLPPTKWPVEHVANVGADEEFVKNMLEMHPLVDAGTIYEPKRTEVKHAITAILMHGLMPAFLELQQIRASVGQKMSLMNRQQPYEDLARKLSMTYKELLGKAAREMDFRIAFLFDNDKKFRDGLVELRRLHPRLRAGFEAFLTETRDEWQKDLQKFRNTWLEHPVGDHKKFAKFYTPEYAEIIFSNVWQAIVDILPVLLETHFMPGVSLVEQHPDDPGAKWAQRFRYDHPAFRKIGIAATIRSEDFMIRADVVITRMLGSQRLRVTVVPAGGQEQSNNYLNRDEAEEALLGIGLLPIDIQGTFEILDGNEPGTPVSFGLKDLDEELLRQNGFQV